MNFEALESTVIASRVSARIVEPAEQIPTPLHTKLDGTVRLDANDLIDVQS
ncbi:MAG TPA: hypothetical protein VEO54_10855 [Thermoanaerobaculia bacterium]|nr:hypothetical protein [Thermoanaerobaculia bacterium]